MFYTKQFIEDVLSLVKDEQTKEDILSGKISIGEYLSNNVNRRVEEEIRNKDIIGEGVCNQIRINAYFDDWREYYLLRQGSTYKQNRINEEMMEMFNGKNSSLNLKYQKK